MTWKDYPHLFANGKFKIKVSAASNLIIRSYCPITNKFMFTSVRDAWHVDDCTLIARPIADMTDEEIKNLLAEDFLYFLSIGVYPFDQSHFDDGTVIDATTL